jgi:acyl carrier protein
MTSQSLSIVQRLAAETLDLPLTEMTPTITFREAGIDSLSTLDLLFAVEGHFDLTQTPE